MADIHVVGGSRQGGTVFTRAVFHFVVPMDDRVVAAAQDPNLVAFESAVPDIEQTELDAIKAGEVVERSVAIRHFYTASNAAVLARVRGQYVGTESKALADYRARYWQYLEVFAKE